MGCGALQPPAPAVAPGASAEVEKLVVLPQQRAPTTVPGAPAELEGVHVVIESGEGSAAQAAAPVEDLIVQLLQAPGVGFHVVPSGVAATLTLAIRLQVSPVAAQYGNGMTCFTGVNGRGSFALQEAGKAAESGTFEIDHQPAPMVANRCAEASDAPFESAVYGSSDLVDAFARLLARRNGSDAVRSFWLAALASSNVRLSGRAAKALGDLGGSQVVDKLIEVSATEALKKIGKPAVESLVRALKAESPSKRLWAADVLAEIGDTRAVAPISELLQDAEKRVRLGAAAALVRLGDASKLGVLTSAIDDPKEDTRSSAAVYLGSTKNDRAIDVLIAKLETEKVLIVRSNIQSGLQRATGQSFGYDAAAWRKWWQSARPAPSAAAAEGAR